MEANNEFILEIYKKAPDHFYVEEDETEYCQCNYPMEIDESFECEWCGKDIKSDW